MAIVQSLKRLLLATMVACMVVCACVASTLSTPASAHAAFTGSVAVGDTITYTVSQKVNQIGVNAFTRYNSMQFRDTMPAGITPLGIRVLRNGVDVTGSAGSASISGSNVVYTMNVGAMPINGETYQFIITAKVAYVPSTNVFKNTAQVQINSLVLSSNETVTNIYAPEVETHKSCDREEANLNDEIWYTVTFQNKKTGSCARYFYIEDTIPDGLTLDRSSVTITGKSGCSIQGSGNYLKIVGDILEGGECATVKYRVTPDDVWKDVYNDREAVFYDNTVHTRYMTKWVSNVDSSTFNPQSDTSHVTIIPPVRYIVDEDREEGQLIWQANDTNSTDPFVPVDANTYRYTGLTLYDGEEVVDAPVFKPGCEFVWAWFLDQDCTIPYEADKAGGGFNLYARNKVKLTYASCIDSPTLAKNDDGTDVYDFYGSLLTDEESDKREVDIDSRIVDTDLYGETDQTVDHTDAPSPYPWADEELVSNPTIFDYGDVITLRAPRFLEIYHNDGERVRTFICRPWTSAGNEYYLFEDPNVSTESAISIRIVENTTVYKDWSISTFDGVVDRSQ